MTRTEQWIAVIAVIVLILATIVVISTVSKLADNDGNEHCIRGEQVHTFCTV